MINVRNLEQNCETRGTHEKTMKFAEVAQIREFCKFCNARKKLQHYVSAEDQQTVPH